MLGDVLVFQAIELRHQERPLDQRWQGIEHRVDFVQGLQHHEMGFRGGGFLRRQVGEGVEVGAFQCLALVPVDQDALGHTAEVGTRLFDHRDLGREDAREGVLCQVSRIHGVAQLSFQRRIQPAVMATVQGLNRTQMLILIRGKGFAHGARLTCN
ncbi:hypothetical protein D3C73_907940 [compost metagenome]